jgi:hypothetical protein
MSAKKKKPAASKKKPSKSKTKPKTKAKTKTKVKSKASAKAKAKAAPKKTSSAKKKAAPILRRRDATGHIDPRYAKELRALGGHDDADTTAFVGRPRSKDDLAEELGEEFVMTATSGEDEGEDVANQDVPEEIGGPFVVTDADTEFAQGTDASNPKGAKREPFPRT